VGASDAYISPMAAAPLTDDTRLDPVFLRIAGIVLLGVVASLLDTTMVSVALDTLARDLHASVTTIQWVTTAYLLALAVVMPLSGWAVDRFGARRVWLIALVGFLGGSILCGLAWSAGSLIAFRVIQGAGGGLLTPVAQTIITRAAGPKRLGRAMALLGVPAQLGPVLGPVIGGLIVTNLSWRWIFYVNLPICLLALTFAYRGLHTEAGSASRRLDVRGLALLSPGLALFVYGFAEVGPHGGFASLGVLAPLIAGALLLAAFTRHALRTDGEPLIDMRLFKVPAFAGATGVMFVGGLSLFGALLLLPLYEQIARGRTPLQAGLLLLPQGVGTLLCLLVVGRMTDRYAPRPIVFVGLTLTALGTVPYVLAGPSTSEWLLGGAQFVRGFGLAASIIPIFAAAFRDLRSDQIPRASTTVRISQQVGGSLGTAVLAVVLQRGLVTAHDPTEVAHAFSVAFLWALVLTSVAVIPALRLPSGREREKRPAIP
jgi:EmrB/QacA subfamily drug resistance transporter